jgi:hypothetical protein
MFQSEVAVFIQDPHGYSTVRLGPLLAGGRSKGINNAV